MNVMGRTAEPSTPPHVLVVDSDSDTCELHKVTIGALTSDVETALDGADALARALARPPALLITETRLPRIDGFTLCAALRADARTRAAEILVVTGAAFADDLAQAFSSGADAVLVKPASPEQVRAEAERLLGLSRELRERARVTRSKVSGQVKRSQQLIERAQSIHKRIRSRLLKRELTTSPPAAPPELRCPKCYSALLYQRSFVGGVSDRHSEQWDYYTCQRCGTFQYRHRTRRLRQA
jgi:CheY-like chemotaxis protein